MFVSRLWNDHKIMLDDSKMCVGGFWAPAGARSQYHPALPAGAPVTGQVYWLETDKKHTHSVTPVKKHKLGVERCRRPRPAPASTPNQSQTTWCRVGHITEGVVLIWSFFFSTFHSTTQIVSQLFTSWVKRLKQPSAVIEESRIHMWLKLKTPHQSVWTLSLWMEGGTSLRTKEIMSSCLDSNL